MVVITPTSKRGSTARCTAWHRYLLMYYPAGTYTRRLLSASTGNDTFQDSYPAVDAVPITVAETSTLLRCSPRQLRSVPMFTTMAYPNCTDMFAA
jgi:hypothetical protein